MGTSDGRHSLLIEPGSGLSRIIHIHILPQPETSLCSKKPSVGFISPILPSSWLKGIFNKVGVLKSQKRPSFWPGSGEMRVIKCLGKLEGKKKSLKERCLLLDQFNPNRLTSL